MSAEEQGTAVEPTLVLSVLLMAGKRQGRCKRAQQREGKHVSELVCTRFPSNPQRRADTATLTWCPHEDTGRLRTGGCFRPTVADPNLKNKQTTEEEFMDSPLEAHRSVHVCVCVWAYGCVCERERETFLIRCVIAAVVSALTNVSVWNVPARSRSHSRTRVFFIPSPEQSHEHADTSDDLLFLSAFDSFLFSRLSRTSLLC